MINKQTKKGHLKRLTFTICTCFIYWANTAQVYTPKTVLLSKIYHTENTLAVVTRFDKGIDSISFPVDTSLVGVDIKSFDKYGRHLSPKKVYYEYRFTPKADTTYILPEFSLWSHGKKYGKTLGAVTLVKSDSNNSNHLPSSSKNTKKETENVYEKERRLSKFQSRFSKDIKKPVALIWSDKLLIKVGDTFRIIIESNRDLDWSTIPKNYFEQKSNSFEITAKIQSQNIDNGIGLFSFILVCKALKANQIELPYLKLTSKEETLITNALNFTILD